MVKYKIYTGKKVTEIDFPTGYHDLTYGQFLRLQLEKARDIGHILEILTGVPRAVWLNLDVSEYTKVTKYLQFLVSAPLKWEDLQIPKHITINGKPYEVPTNLGYETFGQKILLEGKLSETIGAALRPGAKATNLSPDAVANAAKHRGEAALVSVIPYAVALFMQPKVSGEDFDETKVVALEADILNARAVEVYPVGAFFIKTLLGSLKSGAQRLTVTKPKAKAANYKKGRALKKSKKKRATS